MKKIALILCLVLVASFVLSGCNNSDSIITLEDREVGKIEIQSGNIRTLFQNGSIENIVNCLLKISFIKQ